MEVEALQAKADEADKARVEAERARAESDRVCHTALGIDVEQVSGPSKVTPPTPLWYLFDSEREVIKNCALPSTADILQLLPQERICNRLEDLSLSYQSNVLQQANCHFINQSHTQ